MPSLVWCFLLLPWLLVLQQLVASCNDGARRMERTEQMYTIQKHMDFGKIKVQSKHVSHAHAHTHTHIHTLQQMVWKETEGYKATLTNLTTTSRSMKWFLDSQMCACVCPQPFPLVSSSRWMKKRGELSICSEELSIWKAFSNRNYYLFLFNDVLIVTRKKRLEFMSSCCTSVCKTEGRRELLMRTKLFWTCTELQDGWRSALPVPVCVLSPNQTN